ncbi:MAG: SGNH/GDSL hydrolase family protein [Gammaproteobacteria bacterium]|nr:SGNH/GDSL hydrolase family protein [Gammaproteobacteria bacterium]
MRKIIISNIAILAAGLFIIEIIWHLFYANDIRLSVNVLADTHYQYDVTSLYQSDGAISYNRDKNGFRGEYLNVKDIDIVIVGGSTTDQRYIDDKDEWCHLIEKNLNSEGLNVTIVNAGVDGQSSFGHIKNFDMWFSKIESLQPDYIMFYIGVNDFYKDTNHSYDDLAMTQTSIVKRIIKGSFSYYLYRLTKGITLTKAYGAGHKTMDFQTMETTSTPLLKETEYQSLMKIRLDAYFNRLVILANKTKEFSAIPVFITQRRINHWKENDQVVGFSQEFNYGVAKYNGVDMHYMEKLLNDTTMSMCKKHSNTICIDLATDIEFNLEDFYDFAHNTPSGAAKIGSYLADKIKSFNFHLR